MRRKVSGLSSSTIAPGMPSSGISKAAELPKVLSYPKLLEYDNVKLSLKSLFCYVIRYYGEKGLSVLIYRQPAKDQVVVICGDWFGNNIDMTDGSELANIANTFVSESVSKFIATMRLIKIDQVQLFFAIQDKELILVDIQTAMNKLTGPGMVRDVFGKITLTQEIIKIEVIDDRVMECIADGSGNYGGDLIIKPSRFRMYHNSLNNSYTPMYVEVKR